jgi:hypothetical protein
VDKGAGFSIDVLLDEVEMERLERTSGAPESAGRVSTFVLILDLFVILFIACYTPKARPREGEG